MRPTFLVNPPIKTYQSNAYALGAFLALGEGAYGILDNKFVTWACTRNLKGAPRPIVFLPFIGPSTFSSSGLGSQLCFKANSPAELAKAIASSLQRGFFVRLIVDEYYIPDRRSYRIQHRLHDVLVYSISSDAGFFKLMGYCTDRHYRSSTCSVQELSDGYFVAVAKVGKAGFLAFKAELQRPIKTNLAAIKRQLEYFLQSTYPKPSEREIGAKPDEPLLHGLAVFDACEEYVRSLSPTEWLDRRIFSLALEHSQMMLRRTLRLESKIGVETDKTPAMRATHIAGRLRLLSLLTERRRSGAFFAEMAKLVGELKRESRNAAEILWRTIDEGS